VHYLPSNGSSHLRVLPPSLSKLDSSPCYGRASASVDGGLAPCSVHVSQFRYTWVRRSPSAPDTDGMCIAGDIQGQSKAAMWKLSEPTRVSGILKVSAYLD
jgi:hypothetical protein